MSTWQEGRVYDYYGTPILCERRYFVGSVETVDLSSGGKTITRTARALAPCVTPRVTTTLGGVLSADYCDHRTYGRATADAGPHAGAVCCIACGGVAPALPA
ncbi:MAG: hypothetical protein WC211_00530 [Dehalococcoidia bacterium]